MKKTFRTVIAVALLLIMACISPMNDLANSLYNGSGAGQGKDAGTTAKVAKAAGKGDGTLYISEIRIGNAYYDGDGGPTEDEVIAELQRDGYSILMNGSSYADLNEGADAPNIKDGPSKKKVFLGYKTTTDPSEAITDLAVMNMEGGFSVEDYNTLLDMQMNTQIKPFVDRFIATLNEYRENMKKPKDSVNYVRANTMREYLNIFMDDDTGGTPVGDLLLNETKYEMGDASYNALSASEKKKHADILTMLMQGNGRCILTIEQLLTQASDSSEDTWYERFMETTLDDLVEEIQAENPKLSTRRDIYNELDKKYEDTAKKLLDKWEDFRTQILDYEDRVDAVIDSIDETSDNLAELSLDSSEDATDDELQEFVDTTAQAVNDYNRAMITCIGSCLDVTEYEDGTLYDFFTQDYAKVSKGDGIRKLYPMVQALTPGQIAGLDFISMEELFAMALTGVDGYKEYKQELPEATSVFDGMNREIFEQGGVALTSETIRSEALKPNDEKDNIWSSSDMSTAARISWVITGGFGLFLLGTVAYALKGASKLAKTASVAAKVLRAPGVSQVPGVNDMIQKLSTVWDNSKQLTYNYQAYTAMAQSYSNTSKAWSNAALATKYSEAAKEVDAQIQWLKKNPSFDKAADKIDDVAGQADKVDDAAKAAGSTSSWVSYLMVGVAVIVIVMTVISLILTIQSEMDYYKTDYAPIPKYIVDEVDITAYNERGEKIMIQNQTAYYKAATCNRIEGKSDQEKNNYKALMDRADLNGDIGKEWLALYYAKNEAGSPILADSLLYQKDGGGLPSGYNRGIHDFGTTAVKNLNRKAFLFNTDPPEIKVYYKHANFTVASRKNSTAGSIFGGGGITPAGVALGGGIGIVVGGLLGVLIIYFSRRKKVAVETGDK